MAKYDDFQNVHSMVGAAGGTNGNTELSLGLDTKAMEQCTVVIQVGLIAAAALLDVKIEDSADNSAWADLAGAVFAQQTDTEDNV